MNARLCPCDAHMEAKVRRAPTSTLKPAWKQAWGVQQTSAVDELVRMRLRTL